MAFRIQENRLTISGKSSAVRANLDVRTGGQAIGAAIAGAGGALQALGEKWDLVEATTQLSKSRRQAKERMNALELELDGIDDTSLYDEKTSTALADLIKFAPKNRKAARKYQEFVNDIVPNVNEIVRGKAKAKRKDNFMAELFEKKVEAEKTGITSPFEVMLAKGRIFGFLDKEDSAKMSHETVLNAERNFVNELIRDGKTQEAFTAIDKSHLKATEKTALENSVTNRELQIRNLSNEAYQDRAGKAAGELYDLFTDGTLTDEVIDNIDLQAIGEQKTAEVAFKQKWKKILKDDLKLGDPLVSNDNIYDSLVVGSELVERGAKSPTEWEQEFTDALANRQLSREDRRDLRSKDIVATKTMQNRAFVSATDSTSDSRAALGGVTEDELTALMSARRDAVKLKDIPGVNFINLRFKKSQAQRYNFGRYKKDLRSVMAQNPEWSQGQIFTASEVLLDKYDKDDIDIIKDFDSANPGQAITTTPPSDSFKDFWKKLSFEDRAAIWSERMAGTPISILLDSDEVIEAQK